MSRSGFNRGLAVTAVSALAITGAPFFAGTANAVPLNTQAGGATVVDLVTFEDTSLVTTKNDGQNTTFRLEAIAGSDVSSIRFEYSIAGNPARNVIATVSRNDDGAFMTEWTPAGINGANIEVYAIGLAADGTTIVGQDMESASVDNAAESVNINDGSTVGVFQQPYTLDGETDDEVIVAGTASAAGAIDLDFYNAGAWQDGGAATATVATGATTATWKGIVDIDGYTYGANDQLLVSADNGSSDDTEAYALYKQTITTVTASAEDNSVPAGDSTPVTVTVLDQNGKPIAGAQVFSSNGGGSDYTDENGEAQFNQNGGAANNAYYYANATDSDPYEPELGDKKSDTVAVGQYNPAPTTLNADSRDGAAFDVDEYETGDITVQVEDQEGEDFDTTGQTLNYYWVFTPAGGGTATRTPTTGTTPNPVEVDGEYVVGEPSNGFADDGTYELYGSLSNDPGGNGGIAESKLLTVSSGDAEIVFDEGSPEQAPVGGDEVVSGRLELWDGGPGLPGRPILLTANGPGNAQFNQTTGPDASTFSTVTDANGNFSGTLDDPNADTTREDNSVTAETTNWTHDGDTDNADESATQDVNFETSLAPARVTIAPNGGVNYNSGGNQAGEIRTYTVLVEADSDPNTAGVQSTALTNQSVTLTVDHGYFTDGNPQGAVGDDAGVYDNDGQTITVTTDGSGMATFSVSIGRDAGFDDDGDVTAVITATAGSVSDTENVEWTSENPINPGEVTVEFADEDDQDSTILPKARTDQTVELLVKAFDQFGNRVGGESVDLTDNTNKADVSSPADTDYDEDSDATATGDDTVVQDITASWTQDTEVLVADGPDQGSAPDTADGPNETVTDEITIEWYEAAVTNETVTMDDNTGGEATVGENVTETVTVVDQFGQPVQGYFVEFVRSGPGEQDGDVNYVTVTNANGVATYNFTGTEAGTANITAVVRDTTGSQVATKQDSVVFGEETQPKPPYKAFLAGDSNGAKPKDRLQVNAPNRAEGDVVKLFKIRPNGNLKIMAKGRFNEFGNKNFRVIDTNGRKFIKYVAKVTRADGSKFRTNSQRVR